MSDLKVNFIHPTDGRRVTVTLDDTFTADEVVGELIANDFVQPDSQGYMLAVKGGDLIRGDQTLADASVEGGATLRVLPATDAGH